MKQINMNALLNALEDGKKVYIETVIRKEVTIATTLSDLMIADRIVVEHEEKKIEEEYEAEESEDLIPEEEIEEAVAEAVAEELETTEPDPEHEAPADFVARVFGEKKSKTDEVADLWKQGYGATTICQMLGIKSTQTVYNHLNKAGIER